MSTNDEGLVMQVRGVAKRFSHTPAKARRPGTHDLLRAMLGRRPPVGDAILREDEFWALRDISFDLRRGEALGIVGLNGAGKSTLLKLLLGRLQPDAGTVRVYGRAGGLIELGAGFHPELSGRRNIFISASFLGVPEADVERHLDEIIEFADIGRFIDSPVKTYSSGMRVRLGFAVAVHFVPDVVVCDEVLAVGDFEFRQKCLQRIKEIRRTRSVVLVSHGTSDIALFCTRAMLLHRGECILIDSPEDVLRIYSECSNHISADELRRRSEALLKRRPHTGPRSSSARPAPSPPSQIESRPIASVPKAPAMTPPPSPSAVTPKGSESPGVTSQLFGPSYWDKAAIGEVSLRWSFERNEKGYYIVSGEPVYLQLTFRLHRPVERFRIGLPIFTEAGIMLLGPDSRYSPEVCGITQAGLYVVYMCLDPLPLNGGRFCPVISICDDPAHLYRRHLPRFEVLNPKHEFGLAKSSPIWTTGEQLKSPPLAAVALDQFVSLDRPHQTHAAR